MQSSLSAGADCVIQSSHKTLSALTQAAMLHVQGTRMDTSRLSQALQLLQVSYYKLDALPPQSNMDLCASYISTSALI